MAMTRETSSKGARTQRNRFTKGFAFAAFCLLLSAFCLLPSVFSAQTANPSPTPQAPTAQTSPTSTPTPTPTPPLTLHQWGAVTLFHGLPSDRVRAIAQDADGAMWFGTDGGLAKYDGRRTQAVTVEGLTSKRVLALKLDEGGALWVGTEDGAGALVGGEFRAIPEAAGKVITSIITPERGRAILASEEGVIFDCHLSADNSLTTKTIPEKPLESADFERPGPLNLTSLALKDNVLYVGTRSRGVIAIETGVVREIRSTPRPFFVETIEQDAKNRLWYGAKAKAEDSGLYEASDTLRPKKTGTGLGMVTALRAGLHDDMWVGTDGRGSFHYDGGAHLIERFTFEGTAGGLRSDHVYAIFVDREEVVWFGTDRGVCRYDPHAPRVENVSAVAESNFVRTLFQTSGGRLLSGTNRGLFIYDAKAAAWLPVQELSQSPVYAIAEDRNGRIIVGAGSGLYRAEKPSRDGTGTLSLKRLESPNADASVGDNVRAIAQFQGAIYIAVFGRGVERVNDAGRTLVWPNAQADAQTREVVSLHADRNGKLWIGTALAGVFIFDGKAATTLPALDKLKGSAVWSINDGGNDHLWFGSARGLYLYRAGELKEIVQGLAARHVVTIDDSTSNASVWCATAGGGLLTVLMDEQLGAVVSRLDAEQGLPSQNTFAVLPMRAGGDGDETLLIGTNRGVARYVPGRVAPVLSPVRIIGQRVHQLSELRAGLSLDYPQNSLVLDVSATSSRTFPEQFQYAFQLRDAAGKIIKQKFSRDAQFTMETLRPGKYKVVARAFSKDLIASAPLSFEFNVAGAPFPWTTTALSVLLALALVALWWGYHQNRSLARTGATLKDTNRQLADARMQLANETEAERRRIARDLHDQTLADLRHLLMLTDQLPTNGGGSGHEKAAAPAVFRSEIEAISNEIRRICEDLSPSVLENVGFSAALEWALSNAVTHLQPERKFEYEFAADENLDEQLNLSRATQMQIYRILQEAVSNISRHASAKRVRLIVKTSSEGDFLLTLEDDGRDFDPQDRKIKQGRGLMNIRARASLIEAEVNWKKRDGGGTQFTLRKANAIKTSAAQIGG
ncbi:MAG TPA: two-component regulator propeller domain-containing protein [Pyrinomonadaceae bacterium]|nr:two-component regulator propeller domain-containing protein [Pyrinomonadaceae bacterium]